MSTPTDSIPAEELEPGDIIYGDVRVVSVTSDPRSDKVVIATTEGEFRFPRRRDVRTAKA